MFTGRTVIGGCAAGDPNRRRPRARSRPRSCQTLTRWSFVTAIVTKSRPADGWQERAGDLAVVPIRRSCGRSARDSVRGRAFAGQRGEPAGRLAEAGPPLRCPHAPPAPTAPPPRNPRDRPDDARRPTLPWIPSSPAGSSDRRRSRSGPLRRDCRPARGPRGCAARPHRRRRSRRADRDRRWVLQPRRRDRHGERPLTEDDVEAASRFFVDQGRSQSLFHLAAGDRDAGGRRAG